MSVDAAPRVYRRVTGTHVHRWTAEEVERLYPASSFARHELRYRAGIIRDAQRDLVGRAFVFETLECGHDGDCIGIVGGTVRDPATRRSCEPCANAKADSEYDS